MDVLWTDTCSRWDYGFAWVGLTVVVQLTDKAWATRGDSQIFAVHDSAGSTYLQGKCLDHGLFVNEVVVQTHEDPLSRVNLLHNAQGSVTQGDFTLEMLAT